VGIFKGALRARAVSVVLLAALLPATTSSAAPLPDFRDTIRLRRVEHVEFTASGATTLQVSAPVDGAAAPPGYYMMFVVDEEGVPSEASWVRVE
jgi:hypothetical protein